jgi:protoporphyrin/coproporphyrin ferrochelatase
MTGPVYRNPEIGVVLLQLGGPDSLESVEPFLCNLFSDPDIIDLPLAFLFRKPLARLISGRRAPKVREYYRRIGGRSPILKLTRRQAIALQRELHPALPASVYVAMRYWHPMAAETLEAVRRDGITRVVLLPLYPHYSRTTTGSSVRDWQRHMDLQGMRDMRVDVVEEYCEHPSYIAALIEHITIALRRVPPADRGRVHLVFSAHGTPVKLVEAGDPYQGQIVRTYNAVVATGNFGLSHSLCYQSKVGPERWLEPSLEQTVRKLAGQGVSHMLVVPIAFVSDHSETLWEINIQIREEAKALGVRYYDIMPALHTNPSFIRALADLVRTAVHR